jgi:hypothetical protein
MSLAIFSDLYPSKKKKKSRVPDLFLIREKKLKIHNNHLKDFDLY